jgi:PAS domain S-box-containing protein
MTISDPAPFSMPDGAVHAVQFYDDEASLQRTVGDFLAGGLDAGERILVVATPEHWESFRGELETRECRIGNRLIFADARQTLARISSGDSIDENSFHEVVGTAVASAAADGTRVRAYGEMVELLWADGKPDAALRLEELWNDLARAGTFSLLCAYSMGHFYKTSGSGDLDAVCRQHDHVVDFRRHAQNLETEIAHRKELERALVDALAERRRAENDLRDFLENATIGIHRVGPDGTILWANRAELEMLGYEEAEYVGRNIAEFYAEPEQIADILRRLLAGEALRDCEAKLVAKDGTVRQVSVDSNARFENGRFLHSRCFTKDITDRKRIEESNRVLYERAQSANRAKDEFLATLSHELRTPLTAILGWARLLTMGNLDSETMRAAVQTIERSARTQAALIDDLLDLSRVVTGKLTLERDLVDLIAVAESAVETQRLAAEAKGIRLTFDVPQERIVVVGDATRLQQVIWNLVANAIKFSPADSSVGISVERDGRTARIRVRDNGKGIGAEFLPHVFEPFRQAEAASTRAYGGLGLGLAIVKYLVESHGGRVSAHSDGDHCGAMFEVRLPLASRTAIASQAEETVENVDLSGLSVLLVDDDTDTRELIEAILRGCGATVHAADSVASALETFAREKLDVVITDIAMPHRDGFDLLAHVRQSSAIPVVALTAFSPRLDRQGFEAYIQKPIEPMRFAREIASLRART